MVWAFETEPEFQRKLDWAEELVRREVEPLDLVLGDPHDKGDARAMAIVRPLQDQVRADLARGGRL
jgi:acyl-CoA dehydrogenase